MVKQGKQQRKTSFLKMFKRFRNIKMNTTKETKLNQ